MKTKQLYSRTFFIIGIIIGLGFAIIYNYKTKINNEKQDIARIVEQNNISDTTTELKEAKIVKAEIKTEKIVKKKIISKKEPIKVNTDTAILIDSIKIAIIENDSLRNDSIFLNDSIIEDTVIVNYDEDTIFAPEDDSLEYKLLEIEPNNSEINIVKDELIYANILYPSGNKDNFGCNTNSDYDSILVNNVVRSTKDGLYVEFWHSPINSTGYKLSHNTLVLYGFYEYKNIELKYLKNGFIELKYKNNTLLLQCNDNFTPLHIEK